MTDEQAPELILGLLQNLMLSDDQLGMMAATRRPYWPG